ncbi:hypothetical protein E6W39_03405 [Kitasatospora acidiphila]|uniref:Enoyl reductase (ER) domain-containing protein n=1 Tax=Kitasatospora acidiphila TaxID=2567942 RepID=A0A540WDJ0_9ACTN|nr:hypothetical protein E6W39_03405 [Kitasatospora acidiphila]
MRRVRYHQYGGPEVLTLEEADTPVPGPGQVLLRTEAIGANFVDTEFRRGVGSIFNQPLPGILTGDVVGTVEAVGPGVAGELTGQRVATLAEDAFADYVVADAAWLASVPDGVDLGTATTLPMAAPLALRTLRLGRTIGRAGRVVGHSEHPDQRDPAVLRAASGAAPDRGSLARVADVAGGRHQRRAEPALRPLRLPAGTGRWRRASDALHHRARRRPGGPTAGRGTGGGASHGCGSGAGGPGRRPGCRALVGGVHLARAGPRVGHLAGGDRAGAARTVPAGPRRRRAGHRAADRRNAGRAAGRGLHRLAAELSRRGGPGAVHRPVVAGGPRPQGGVAVHRGPGPGRAHRCRCRRAGRAAARHRRGVRGRDQPARRGRAAGRGAGPGRSVPRVDRAGPRRGGRLLLGGYRGLVPASGQVTVTAQELADQALGLSVAPAEGEPDGRAGSSGAHVL